MLELGNEFYQAWGIYLVAVLCAQLLLWKLTAGLKWRGIGSFVQLSSLAVLITPAKLQAVEGPGNYWAPGFITAVMEGLGGESEAALGRLLPMLALLLVFTAILLLSTLWRRKAA
jgi:hypothetical protein